MSQNDLKPCKWLSDDFDEICTNGDCEACADFCPCVNYPTLCRHYEEGETNEQPRDN